MPRRKDQLVKLSDGIARVKKMKYLGKNEDGERINTQVIKNPDKSTVTNRYKSGNLVASDYNPKKMKVKKIKKMKKTRVPRKLKKVKAPGYISPEVTLDKNTQAIADARGRKANKSKISKIVDKVKNIKLPKIKKGRKVRKTRNLVTGKINKTRG
jgi:hypothetical protein